MLSFDKGSCHMQSFFVSSQWQFGCKRSPGPNSEMPNPGIEESGENARMVWIAGWIVGLLTTYMTSVARAAGHWVLRCRDCLGKLLRQQGRARGKRQGRRQGLVGALGSEANREAAAAAAAACEPGPRTPTHSRNFSRHPQMHTSQFDHQKRRNALHKVIFNFKQKERWPSDVFKGPLMQG